MFDHSQYSNLPIEHLLESLDAWAKQGRPMGDFLTRVVENDLFGCLGHADINSRMHLFDVCRYIYNELPSSCWGSKEKVAAWAKERAEKGPLE